LIAVNRKGINDDKVSIWFNIYK